MAEELCADFHRHAAPAARNPASVQGHAHQRGGCGETLRGGVAARVREDARQAGQRSGVRIRQITAAGSGNIPGAVQAFGFPDGCFVDRRMTQMKRRRTKHERRRRNSRFYFRFAGLGGYLAEAEAEVDRRRDQRDSRSDHEFRRRLLGPAERRFRRRSKRQRPGSGLFSALGLSAGGGLQLERLFRQAQGLGRSCSRPDRPVARKAFFSQPGPPAEECWRREESRF